MRWLLKRLCLVAAALAGSACDDTHTLTATPTEGIPVVNAYEVLARSVAVAMADEDLRVSVLRHMRASRMVEHKLDLSTYLRDDGHRLLGAAAKQASLTEAGYLRLLGQLPSLEFYVPDRHQRTTWSGGADIYVASASRGNVPSKDDPFVTAFDTQGRRHVIDVVNGLRGAAVFGILPLETDFENPTLLLPASSYDGVPIQAPDECHPLQEGCGTSSHMTSNGSEVGLDGFSSASGGGGDTTLVLYRFKLLDDEEAWGANEIEVWYWLDGGPNDPDPQWPDDGGAPCVRFGGIDPDQWYVLDMLLGSEIPTSTTSIDSYWQEDDFVGCQIYTGAPPPWSGDELLGTLSTVAADLYPTTSYQTVGFYSGGFQSKAEVSLSIDDGSSPPTPPLSAIIDGPVEVRSEDYCTWEADVSGGVSPYTYQWSGALSGTGSWVGGYVNASGWLTLIVTDDEGTQDGEDFYIEVVEGEEELCMVSP